MKLLFTMIFLTISRLYNFELKAREGYQLSFLENNKIKNIDSEDIKDSYMSKIDNQNILLGVIGGLGPEATLEFYRLLIDLTPASKDNDHIPTVIWANSRRPNFNKSILNGGDHNKSLNFLLQSVNGLVTSGCNLIVCPCNTAHYWFDEYTKNSSKHVNYIHIVDSVADTLRKLNIKNTKIGVIGTLGTIKSNLYQKRLNKLEWEFIVPTDREMLTLVQPAINFVKGKKYKKAHYMLMKVIFKLIKRGAEAIILACTEIPLVIKEKKINGVPIINTIESLVKSTIIYVKGNKK